METQPVQMESRFPKIVELVRMAVLVLIALAALVFSACTGSVPGSFHLQQQEQAFDVQIQVNTKIDLLWVVDNSASMDVSQDKLRKGFTAFAQKYMQPTWDIRVAVITTDAYLANPAFSTYLNTTIPLPKNFPVGSPTMYQSSYISSRLATFVNPAWNPTLVNLLNGTFPSGLKYKELVPAWGPSYAQLLPGLHDGPIAGLCWEGLPYFLFAETKCNIRDDQNAYNGPSHCLNPSGSETAITQCVNTVENDTIHSGKAIISTMPPQGIPGDAAWIQQLINNFMINVTTGAVGGGSERGMSSVLQLLSDNEDKSTAFFRKDSLRAVIFVSDEDDQSMTLPATPPAGFSPFYDYACDQAGLIAANGSAPILGVSGAYAGYCCSPGNCNYGSYGTYGQFGISCAPKTVDGFTYTTGICPVASKLLPVSGIKGQMDSFFRTLQADASADPNYFIVAITPLTGQSIQIMGARRAQDDTDAGALKISAVNRGDRYIALANTVGNGSMTMDIAEDDYSPILDAIGRTIIEKQGTFVLNRVPTGAGKFVVAIAHANGTQTVVPSDKFSLSGNVLQFTDLSTILAFTATDKIVINYEPSTVF
jgi:hypothetical protein